MTAESDVANIDTSEARPVAAQPLHVLLYRSHSLVPKADTDAELARILRGARANNAALGVTGALMLYDNWFAQVLEGPTGAVRALYGKIKLDPRHNGVELMHEGGAAQRAFERWAMAHVGEHGDPDIPLMAVGDHVAPAAAWRTNDAQEALLGQLRQATRGYGRGS